MDYILDFVDNLLENSTPEAPAWNIEQVIEKKEPHWNYIDGCMLKAIFDIYYARKNEKDNEKYFDFIKNYIDFYVNENGHIKGYKKEDYNCDNINEGKILFDLYKITGENKYKLAIEKLQDQLKTHPRISAGNFWHKQIYPNQVWLDGLYMVQPFYIEYETLFNNKKNYQDIFSQFENVQKVMIDEKTGLLYHGYDESKQMFWASDQTGLSPNFWTRSLGWYMMALVDTLEKMEDKESDYNQVLKKYLISTVDAVLKFQDSSKLFYQVPTHPDTWGNYLETSGSCAIAYSLLKGARLGYLSKEYFDKGKEIFNAVKELKLDKEKFVLKDICLVAGLGGMPGKGDYKLRDGTVEYYLSEPKVENDAKGVAPFLFAYSELLRS